MSDRGRTLLLFAFLGYPTLGGEGGKPNSDNPPKPFVPDSRFIYHNKSNFVMARVGGKRMSQGYFADLKDRLGWLSARQTVLARNVANANTPGFKPQDLSPFAPHGPSGLGLVATEGSHLAGADIQSDPRRVAEKHYEVRPSGNAVTLEDEMSKLADVQLDYQLASTLYVKSLGLIKIALGRK